VTYQADPAGSFWQLRSGRTVVGRAGAADGLEIEINDQTTSSNHCVFHADAGTRTVSIEDTNSTNGTFVNDERLPPNGRRDLRDGDRVRLGAFNTVVKVISRT
jgi:pSer/pThr/pTyr-binding forkhead associated (FHA) protein